MMFFRRILPFVLIVFMPFGISAEPLPDLTHVQESPLALEREKELGKTFIHMVKARVPLVRDSMINDYIRRLGNRLVVVSDRPSKTYRFFVVNDPDINAFSGPDGHIGLNMGLILSAQSESELAAVLAHEIAHVSGRHIMRLMDEQKTLRFQTVATILVALALGLQNPNAGFGVLTASEASKYQHMINFLRAREKEADRIGMRILVKAGFDPRSMVTFFNRLAREDRFNRVSISPLLQTHPVTTVRLADAYNVVSRYPKYQTTETLDFRFIQARVQVDLSHHPKTLLHHTDGIFSCCRYKKACLNCYIRRAGLKYTDTLALMKLGELSKAKRQIDALMLQFPRQSMLKITAARIAEYRRHDQEALGILLSLYRHQPSDYPVLMAYTSFLVRQQKFRQAARLLEKQHYRYEEDENYLRLLSEAFGRGGELSAAYQVRAEIYLLNGNKRAAGAQLEMALKFAKKDGVRRQIRIKLRKLGLLHA